MNDTELKSLADSNGYQDSPYEGDDGRAWTAGYRHREKDARIDLKNIRKLVATGHDVDALLFILDKLIDEYRAY